jgi:ATP-dependent protease Clp ATPase subunit
MKHKHCSFCGKSAPEDIAEAKLVSGKEVAVCRNCMDLMIEVYARKDKRWCERTIFTLRGIQTKT